MLVKLLTLITIIKGEIDMVVIYVALIVAGRKTFAQVPLTLKEQVKA